MRTRGAGLEAVESSRSRQELWQRRRGHSHSIFHHGGLKNTEVGRSGKLVSSGRARTELPNAGEQVAEQAPSSPRHQEGQQLAVPEAPPRRFPKAAKQQQSGPEPVTPGQRDAAERVKTSAAPKALEQQQNSGRAAAGAGAPEGVRTGQRVVRAPW